MLMVQCLVTVQKQVTEATFTLCNTSERVGSQRYTCLRQQTCFQHITLFYITSDKLIQTWDLYLRQWQPQKLSQNTKMPIST